MLSKRLQTKARPAVLAAHHTAYLLDVCQCVFAHVSCMQPFAQRETYMLTACDTGLPSSCCTRHNMHLIAADCQCLE